MQLFIISFFTKREILTVVRVPIQRPNSNNHLPHGLSTNYAQAGWTLLLIGISKLV